MSRPPARAPNTHEPMARTPNICDLHICEPLIATLVLLIVLLTYGQVLPAPFVPVPHPPTSAVEGTASPPTKAVVFVDPTSTPTAAVFADPTLTPTAIATAAPSDTSLPAVAQPTWTSSPEIQPTATLPSEKGATPTLEPSPMPTETDAPTPSPMPTDEPTATPEVPGWDLAQDIIGLWEQVDQNWQYYFDFLEDGIVMVAENGARTYEIAGNQTIVIRMPSDAWVLTVRDLSEDRVILEGVFGPSDEFHRENGVPNLRQAMIGLWAGTDADSLSLEFTPGGIALGKFGRGTYRVVSNSHVFIECDDLPACFPYREYAQPDDAPLSLRVYEIVEDRMTVLGLGQPDKWTLEQFEGHPTLAADIVGLWEDESGSTLQFTGEGELMYDGDETGSYEVLSETTLWVELDGSEEAWVIVELDADTMSYIELDFVGEDPWVYSRVE